MPKTAEELLIRLVKAGRGASVVSSKETSLEEVMEARQEGRVFVLSDPTNPVTLHTFILRII